MFLGHFGLGLAGKRLAPMLSLGTLFLAVQFADLLFWILALLGVEHFRISPGATAVSPFDFYDYPISHSLVGLVGWGLLVGVAYLLVRGNGVAALVVGLGIVSHWLLDFVVHRPDMPVMPRGPYLGLGLWNSLFATVLAELLLYGLGIAIYLKTTRAVDRTGAWALWTLLVFLAFVWAASIVRPPPPNERTVELSGIAMWLFVPWGYWIDRHRTVVERRS
ncbi:MAG TPA: hypothetical protein VGL03_07915 [Thermoanaerobaculia bacterium]